MDLQQFTQQLNTPAKIDFEDTMAVIEAHYDYTPARFSNGDLINEAGTNEGSCKIFAFAKIHSLSEQQTLNCFGRFYHQDVLENPQNNDHGNIRNFMAQGWAGINFEETALQQKQGS
ncbi:HopJ type III effector protein [Amphritea japonica]|uniref:Type III effector protein n=1 Tax=Amphritea japonica ATCC BAA-1530 TaxID=1278309 RepID=A0A7R6PCQ2_9GAMM|nr:HopJ type III effector protein [Amphritea japonica]BBB26631.1 type III effector protein [Amphritea japonica ATCC BAA-1530]